MKLVVNNFAKIAAADMVIDGITVIAGENNTGKSTIGKILFSLFNALDNIDEKIEKQRKDEFFSTFDNTVVDTEFVYDQKVDMKRLIEYLKKYWSSSSIKNEKIMDIEEDESGIPDEIKKKIEPIFKVLPETILREAVTRYFGKVFFGQINSLTNQSLEAELELDIKGKLIKLSFKEDQCTDFNREIALTHKAVYIDNPFVMESLNGSGNLNPMDNFLRELLINNEKNDVMDGIISSVLAKEKLEDIYAALQSVVEGVIVEKQSNEYFLENKNFKNPISINNLSTGLKAFVLIKMLLEKGILKEKDVLILDEPEIHLHTQWQVAYAELIVLLQKHFDLSIVVATHSPYFLDAINLYSIKYGIDKKTNYYLSSMEKEGVYMENVTGNIDKIYKKMATPIQTLDTLRYELNNN